MWCELILANDKSVRHIHGKIRELFGSRKVGDDGYDATLRPRNSDEMNQRIRAFVECKEQWYMLKRRAVMQSKASPNGVDSCQTNMPRREDPCPNDTQLDSLVILADTAKSLGFPNSDASVETSEFDFTSGFDFTIDCNLGGMDLPVDSNPGGFDFPMDYNPGGIDLSMDYDPGGFDLLIDYNPGEWGELNASRFSWSDGGCISDQVHNSSAGSFTSTNSVAGFSRAFQRRARNRKNQRASRMCQANSTVVDGGSNIACRTTQAADRFSFRRKSAYRPRISG
jgi:hypothetical protein